MKRSKWLIVVLMVSAVGSVFAGPQSQRSGGGRKTLAFCPPAMISPYYQSVIKGAQEAANKLGYDLITLAPDSESNFAQQVQIVEDFVTRNVDGIILCAINTDAIVSAVRRANQANIPVVMFNIQNELAGGAQVASYVLYDQRDAGRKVGQFVVQSFSNAKVGLVLGLPSEHTTERRAGFLEGIAGSNVEVVAEQPGDWEREKGMNAATNMLTARSDISVFFGLSDEMALGAYQAVARANATSRVAVVGFDGTPAAISSVRAGQLLSTISIGGEGTGYACVEALDKVINRQPVQKFITVDTELVTRANASRFPAE